ncbi:MAG TPA: MobF family relaxase, partial [Ilumatobacteraceae bacterium]
MHPTPPYLGVLSIAKLRVGQEAYHLSGVAQSLGDYYSGAGEAHGQWIGGGASRLGLDGQVDPDDLRAVLAGLRPGTGGLTPNGATLRPHPRRVPGFDLTFKAPKSASVLYAVSDDPRVQGAVVEAGEAAMRVAIGYLEREAVRVQRGSHNLAYLARLDPHDRQIAGPRRLATSGMVAASFRHRTSRAGDPLLHWHVLVANVVEGSDGKWSSLVHPEIYQHARAAGEVFQAVYRDELSRRLGIEWRPGRHVPEIAGIPQHVIDAFSKRSQQVEAWLEATGTPNTIPGRHAAVLATRRNKPEREPECFDAVWKIEAESLGWGPAHAEGLVVASMRRNPTEIDDVWRLETVGLDEQGQVDTWERTVTPDEWIADVLRRDLTADRTTFTQPELTTAIARRLGDGASIDTIERLTRYVLASPQTIAVEQPDLRPPTWTTREILEVEQHFIAALGHRSDLVVPESLLRGVLDTRTDLGDDQRTAVHQICTSTAAVAVLVGPAGTGKTYTIDTIRSTCEAAGIPVTGVAPSARAAHELATATGMATTTMHRYRLQTDTAPTGLLVIDEAGMADIRTLTNTITTPLDRGGRVLLAGDHHQLPEIGAGGGFRYAAHHATTLAELTVNRRQHNHWERTALTELRAGNVATAVAAYFDHDRVHIAATPTDLVDQAIALWAEARATGLE